MNIQYFFLTKNIDYYMETIKLVRVNETIHKPYT